MKTLVIRYLELGADECAMRPARQLEFPAKAKALLRRINKNDCSKSIVTGLLRLDVQVARAYLSDKEIALTRTENIILRHL